MVVLLSGLLTTIFTVAQRHLWNHKTPPRALGDISSLLPHIISFAVGFAVPDETSAGLIQVLAALRTLEAGCVPLQVGGDSQYVLVMDLTSTSYTHRESWLLCKEHTGLERTGWS